MATTTTTTTVTVQGEFNQTKPQLVTGADTRLAARKNTILSTCGLSPTYLQANLIILPQRYATDFRLLCQRNPVPCPLVAEFAPGQPMTVKSNLPGISDEAIAKGIDIRTDAPRYNVYKDGQLVEDVADLHKSWNKAGEEHVAFLIGCSFSFENALKTAGFAPRNMVLDRMVPMYRTSIPLNAAGVFSGSTMVVSMRPYPKKDVEAVRAISRPYVTTHGEPVAWGWDCLDKLGIKDVNIPQWGDAPVTADGKPLSEGDEENIPVFWGCGVTPQEAVMAAKLEGTVMGHVPGHMVVLDVKESDVIQQ